jgi:hypothetical protein
MTNRKIQYWIIPPDADAEFVANMEEVLDTYAKPYDPSRPVLCMDEQPVQLVKETRQPIEATAKHPRRVDYEYERAGTANIFMFTEPLAGWREATAREAKTKVDWALEMARLLEGRYRKCDKVTRLRQPQHAHKRRVLRSLPAGPCSLVGSAYRILPHAQARKLAEYRGERTQFPDAAMHRRRPHRRPKKSPRSHLDLVRRRQQIPTRRRLANEYRRRPL